MTTVGDMIIGGTAGAPSRLAAGTSTYVLTSNGAGVAPSWQAATGGFSNPMTTVGDLIVGGAAGAAGRMAAGTSGYVLTSTGPGNAPAWSAASGLTNWTEGVNSSSPNATIPVVSLVPNNAATNVDTAITPKGTGAFLAVASSATLAKRGTNAVDLQMSTSGSSQVASGNWSVVSGGDHNTAAGVESVIAGGSTNSTSAQYTVVSGGSSNSASAQGASISGGQGNAASGTNATVVGGANNTASGAYSIAGGQFSTTRGIQGAQAFAPSRFSTNGDAQAVRYILRATTTTATQTALAADGNTPVAANSVVMPVNSCYDFTINIVARNGNTAQASYKIEGTIMCGATASTCALVGTPTVTAKGVSSGASSWAVGVSANTTLGGLAVNVTGAASTTITWVARVDTVELAA
jgi:hypothetical protein